MKTATLRPSQITRTSHKRLTTADRLKELKAVLWVCFATLHDCGMDAEQIAKRTKLHPSTIYRLVLGAHTLAVRFGTVQAIGYAAGMRLELTEYKAEVTLCE